MTTTHRATTRTHGDRATRTTRQSSTGTATSTAGTSLSPAGRRSLAALRIGLGLVFAWAFFDKAFGWGYATPSARAWINGGSPTAGFLGNVDVGPFQGLFSAMAGQAIWDWLFMLGLLAIGAALLTGVALRLAAVGGVLMMVLMWAAEWPPATTTLGGEATSSTNPLVDYHIIYALALVVIAATAAHTVWSLGSRWQQTRIAQRYAWLS